MPRVSYMTANLSEHHLHNNILNNQNLHTVSPGKRFLRAANSKYVVMQTLCKACMEEKKMKPSAYVQI